MKVLATSNLQLGYFRFRCRRTQMGHELKKNDHSFLSEFLIFFAAATATIKIVRRPKKRERKKKTQLMWHPTYL